MANKKPDVLAIGRTFLSGTREDMYDVVYGSPHEMSEDLHAWLSIGFEPWQIRPWQNMLDGRWHVTYRKTTKHTELPFPLTLDTPPQR